MQKKIHDEQKKSKTKDTFKASKGKLLVHQNLTESAKKKKKASPSFFLFPTHVSKQKARGHQQILVLSFRKGDCTVLNPSALNRCCFILYQFNLFKG